MILLSGETPVLASLVIVRPRWRRWRHARFTRSAMWTMAVQLLGLRTLLGSQRVIDFGFHAFLLNDQVGLGGCVLIRERAYLCLVKFSIPGRFHDLAMRVADLLHQRVEGGSFRFQKRFEFVCLRFT